MEDTVVALLFLMFALVNGYGVYVGYRGWVTDPEKHGWPIPDKVRDSPELTRVANSLVTRWCAVSSVLALIPAVALMPRILSEFQIELSIKELLAIAAYGMVVSVVAGYPFDRISRL
ncbi:hypothetical protein [Rhodococcus marinonascens]|uniref:hypothetical protein n=1 Tax=Rhodococcus marinonascens TaxID=38311 RepID=UPI000934B7FB|nr:hypothetical protein [Rhodococcus marinonascens]